MRTSLSARIGCPRKPNLLTVCLLVCRVFWFFCRQIWGRVAQKVCFRAFCVPDHRQICLLVCRVFFLRDFSSVASRKRQIRRTAAPSSRKRLRSYHPCRLDFYVVLTMLPFRHPPSPSKHLGLFWREKKHQVFSPAAADET